MKLVACIVYILILGILSHYIGESLPRSWFVYDRFPFKPFKWEKNGDFYNVFHIKKWKTKVPDMSRIMKDMLPKRVEKGATSESIEKLIRETCVAEVVHKILCVLSIGIYFIWKNTVGVIISALCIIGNLPFIIIQRYNRPHLVALKNKLQIREARKNEMFNSIV